METSQLNTWLTLWAAIGPILTAGVGAWWSRRKQTEDRTFNSAQEKNRLDSIRDDAEAARIRQEFASRLTWRRQVFIDFLSASFDFVWKGQGSQEPEIRERHRERFSKCFATLLLLDSPDIGMEAVNVWNACLSYVAVVPGQEEQTYKQLRDAREAFSLKAFHLLAEQVNTVDPLTGIPRSTVAQTVPAAIDATH